MEENQPKTGKFSLNFGLLTGGIGVIFAIMLLTMDMHYDQGWGVRGTQMAILAGGIIFGILQFKNANSGFLSLSEALKLGAGIGLISAIVGIAYFLVLSNVIEPDYMDKSFEIAKQTAMEQNPEITEEQMDQGLEMQKKYAWVSYPIIILFNVILGLIVGLLAGLVMKKQKEAY